MNVATVLLPTLTSLREYKQQTKPYKLNEKTHYAMELVGFDIGSEFGLTTFMMESSLFTVQVI